jgi:hypothetical protein
MAWADGHDRCSSTVGRRTWLLGQDAVVISSLSRAAAAGIHELSTE